MADEAEDRAEIHKDSYYYIMIALGWICGIGAVIALWAQTPWFPWK